MGIRLGTRTVAGPGDSTGVSRSRDPLAGDALYLVFRGTPLLVQLFLLYYGLPQLFPIFVGMDAFTAAIVGLTLHFAAYMAESIRASIIGIHKSQMEAALSIGMSRYQAMQRIILPQAARIATPSLMNYFIDMIKSTSLAFTLGVAGSWARRRWKPPPPSSSSRASWRWRWSTGWW